MDVFAFLTASMYSALSIGVWFDLSIIFVTAARPAAKPFAAVAQQRSDGLPHGDSLRRVVPEP